MASSALEEKIIKIRQQNEEIKRRYEEVEEDKKNAAKLNACVQMVPSTDWPERKEPPEFSNPPKTKPKPTKEKHEYIPQTHVNEGKKVHSFAQGEGPPPDPKYNFLADSEREESNMEYTKESNLNRSQQKTMRTSFRGKKTSGRDRREGIQKDNRPNKGNYRDEFQPGYDAWRAERNRIDEDRISRQRTAEGNWRREWDNDKLHVVDDAMKKSLRSTFGDFAKKDYKDSDRKYYNNNEHVNYSRGSGHRPHRGTTKNFHTNYENRSYNSYDQHRNNTPVTAKRLGSPNPEERTVVATDKSIKVIVNQGNVTKGPVMSVKVNSPNIVGTGRVGPRQRTRVTYSHSDIDASPVEGESFFRQKSFEDKSKGTHFNNQKLPNLKRSHSQKKKENETKYKHHQKKDNEGNSYKHYENEFGSYTQTDEQKSYSVKSPKFVRANTKIMKQESLNASVSQKHEGQDCSASHEVNFGQNAEYNTEHDVEQNIERVIDYDIPHSVEDNVEFDTKCNTECNVTAEIIETLQETRSEDLEILNVENKQTNIENEATIEVLPMEEAETNETLLTIVCDADNPEHIAKDKSNTSDNKNECSGPYTNDLEELSNKSSEALVPNNIQSNEELVPNKNIQLSNDIVKVEAPTEEDKQLKQVTRQLVNDCDNIENEVKVQRNTEEVIDNTVPSLEDKTHSVIEINNQSVCDNELVQTEEKADVKNESLEQNLKDTVDSSEKNVVNVVDSANIDKDSVEKNTEQLKVTNDTEKEKGIEKNDNML